MTANHQSLFQMKQFNRQVQEQAKQLQKIPQKILPNIMKLLGQHGTSCSIVQLPSISQFYISPLSKFTLIYNSIYILLFYFMQVQLPLIIAFGQGFVQTEFINQGLSVFYWFIFGFFVLDVAVNMHKGYYEYGKGKVCDDRRKIIMHYLKTQVYFDILATACLIIPRVQSNPYIDLLLFIPIIFLWIKKFKYVKEIINILQYQRMIRIIFTLGTLFIDVLLQGHYGACIFSKIDLVLWAQQYYGNNTAYYWMSNNNNYAVNLMDTPWYDQYVYAQSFSTGTLSTLAPGPFVKNPIQVCFALFVMIYFMLFASYIAEILISTLYSQEAKRVFHEENVQDFDKYMIAKNISDTLKTRIYNFFELIWEVETRLQTQQQRQAVNLLPMNLKEELLVELSFVKNFFMLQYVAEPKRFEKLLALKINRTIVDSGTCLFKQARLIKRKQEEPGLTLNNIYFLSRGMVKYYVMTYSQSWQAKSRQESFFNFRPSLPSQKSSKDLHHQQQKHELTVSLSNSDKFIGLYEFLTKRSMQYCCKAIDLCEIDTITRKDFMQVLKITQNDQVFYKIRHQIMAENQINVINKVCSICFEPHLEQKCPIINVRERFAAEMLQTEGNYGRSQLRKRNLIIRLAKGKDGKIVKSKKVHHKQKPILQKQEAWSAFSSVIGKSNFNLQEFLFSATKIDQIQQSHIWRKYYPEDNMDRINYMILNSQARGE